MHVWNVVGHIFICLCFELDTGILHARAIVNQYFSLNGTATFDVEKSPVQCSGVSKRDKTGYCTFYVQLLRNGEI